MAATSTDGGLEEGHMVAKLSRIVILALSLVLFAAVVQGRPVSADGSWKPAGPTGGYVWEIEASPDFQADGTIFASTYGTGVFRSTDHGDTWRNVSSGFGHRSIRAVAVSPAFSSDSTMFAGGPDGVYKSVDGGETWRHSIEGLDNPRVLALAVSPAFATDATLLAGVSDGLYRSTDGGSSWERVSAGLTGATAANIEFSPGFERDSTVFAGMLGKRVISYMWGALRYVTPPGGIFRSTDGGVTWEIYDDLEEVSAMSVSLSPSFEFDSTAFIGTLHSGIYRTTDGGDTWSQVALGLPHHRFLSVEVSPAFESDSTVFAGAHGMVYGSTDGGNNWEQLNGGKYLSDGRVEALAVSHAFGSDGTLFAGASIGGILRSTDEGASWKQVHRAAPIRNVRAVAPAPDFGADPTVFLAPSGGGVLKSTDGGRRWVQVDAGLAEGAIQEWVLPDVWSIAVSPAFGEDAVVFLGSSNGVFRSTDAGDEWLQVPGGGRDVTTPAVAVSPAYEADSTVFAGTFDGVFRSTDGGETWRRTSEGLGDARVWALAVSPEFTSDRTLFAATATGVFRSADGGHTWEAPTAGLPDLRVYSLDVSPEFGVDRTLFAGTSGGLFRSTDGGGSWTRLREGLRDGSSVFAVKVSPDFQSDRTVYAGTDSEGVMRSVDAGQSWEPVNRQLRTLGINSLALPSNYADTLQVFAGTARSGLYSGADLQAGPFFEIIRPVPVSRIYPVLGWVLVVLTVPAAFGLMALYRRITLWTSRRRARRYVGWGPRAAGNHA